MPFRLWYYLAKVGGPVLIGVLFATFFAPGGSWLGTVHTIAMWLLIPLCLCGACLGILAVFGRLRMRCPFCGQSGEVGASQQDGMWMECDSCGTVHGTGLFRLKIVKTGIEEEEP